MGDKVEIDENKKVITKILPRINELKRPAVANIYYAIIVVSLKNPDLDLYLLDKMLVNVYEKCHNVLILFTKLDLCNEKEKNNAYKLRDYYQSLNYLVYFNDEVTINSLKEKLKGLVVTLTGQSGAGKSTFLNKLKPDLNLKTSPISKTLNRGVHTTRHTEIYDIDGIYFVDTPGFSALDLNIDIDKLKAAFPDFHNLNCKYQDCNHDKEDDCKIKAMVKDKKILASRYNNYLAFKKEIYESSSKFSRSKKY